MQPTAQAPTQPLPLLASFTQPSRLFLATVAGALVIGVLLGALVSALMQPKPINPETYTHPLQVQQTSLQEQAHYGRIVTFNYVLLDTHYNQLVNDLNANNLNASEADATLLSTSTATFLTDLKGVKVPACLQATNTAFVQGLTAIQPAAASLDKALVANDAGLSDQAGRQIATGFSQITTAEQAYASATC